ncbi:superoxide dismutase family protein [Sorangium atrum]|uniref:Superoxide dismutase [Cu-Zn] n=1 Tax=Sorangium atrum TaxID=2995308 RepID=A0ABT5BYE2_9BACT|nr:superoxide dismutase family protein [Sorangium aterium]MDC0679171.1 superoxide dismutase family protein [Sorangium aterium]
MKPAYRLSLLASFVLGATACGGAPEPAPAVPDVPAQPAQPAPEAPAAPTAAAPEAAPPAAAPEAAPPAPPVSISVPIEARTKSKLKGTATFTEVEGGVKVAVQISGAPKGKVAVHVHETGDCSAPDAKSAGAHYNPENHPHGIPDGAPHHLGDLGNIEVKADGTGAHEIIAKGANLKEGAPNTFLGRAIIVHEKADDGSQPAGNAGGRIGCGVISQGK